MLSHDLGVTMASLSELIWETLYAPTHAAVPLALGYLQMSCPFPQPTVTLVTDKLKR